MILSWAVIRQSPVSRFRILNRVDHRLSKYCCISCGVLHVLVRPATCSLRALLIWRRIAGVIAWRLAVDVFFVLSSLLNTHPMVRTICSNQTACSAGIFNVKVDIIYDVFAFYDAKVQFFFDIRKFSSKIFSFFCILAVNPIFQRSPTTQVQRKTTLPSPNGRMTSDGKGVLFGSVIVTLCECLGSPKRRNTTMSFSRAARMLRPLREKNAQRYGFLFKYANK